ncbi:jg23195, partial [Pararge aegeria aegeria]
FFKYIVSPLMVQWNRFLQNDLSRQMLENLAYNTKKWEAMLDQELTQNKKIEISHKDDFNVYTKLWTSDEHATTSKGLSELNKCPLYSAKPTGLKKKLCRLSGSVTCQDFRFWHRDQPSSSDSGSKADEEDIMEDDEKQKLLTYEEPLPDTSVESDPTPVHEAVGTQLYKNILQLNTGVQMGRRKSMPTESIHYSPMEIKLREVTASIPLLLLRTLTGKETCSRRRGSAPAPLAQSEFKGVVSSGGLRHSVNGSPRKQSPLVACHLWISSRSQHAPRRGSLPAELLFCHCQSLNANHVY